MNTTPHGLPESNPWAENYRYAALVDADGNEQPITDSMVRSACEEVMGALFAFLPQRALLQRIENQPGPSS